MKIIFNELGVITSIDTTDEPIRQGNVGVNNLIVDFSQMNGVNNLEYSCVFTYVRPDKSKINDVIMLSSAENIKYFEFNFSNKWFFELYGDASITVKLLKDNTVLANGEFNIVIEKTSADNEPQITYDEYLHLVESITKTQQDAKQYTDDSVQALKDFVGENYAEKTYVDNELNLCVKLTDIDTDFSLTSTNPLQNKVISSKLNDIDYKIMIIKEQLFETVLSEIDYKVDYATIYPIPDTLSDDDGTHRVVYSDTQLKEIEGNSVAFNQLAKTNGISETINGITFTSNNDGSWTVNGTATATAWKEISLRQNNLSGHKMLLKGCPKGFETGVYLGDAWDTQNYENGNGIIYTKPSASGTLRIGIGSGVTVNNIKFYPMWTDLTLMGLDSITTVEEFNRIFPLTYYPYNAGEIKSTVIKGVKVNGYNLFDGEWQDGSLDTTTGEEIANVNRSRSDFIKVIAGQTYSLGQTTQSGITGSVKYLYEYDGNQDFVKYTEIYQSNPNWEETPITLSNNTQYVRIVYPRARINDNQRLHITGSRTGYAPYKEPRIIEIPQTELPSAGSVHDTIKIVEGNVVAGQQRYNMVRVSRINSVDLGTLNWRYISSNGRMASSSLDGIIKKHSSYVGKPNIVCAKYTTDTPQSLESSNPANLTISIGGNGIDILIYDSSYTDATTFKTAMSGVILNYEKAEYTETTLATDLTFEEVSAIIEQGGSIETIFEVVPPNLKTAFAVNKAIVS